MVDRTFDAALLRGKLAKLDNRGNLLFALSCAERMLPNYRQFVKSTSWGDETRLRDILDLGWKTLHAKEWLNPSAAPLQKMEDACMEEAPDTEDLETVLVSSAIDAAIAAVYIAQYLRTNDGNLVLEIAKLARNTVDLVVQEIEALPANAPDLEDRIRAHVLMQNELFLQEEALADAASDFDASVQESRWANAEGNLPEINEDDLRFPRAVTMPARLL